MGNPVKLSAKLLMGQGQRPMPDVVIAMNIPDIGQVTPPPSIIRNKVVWLLTYSLLLLIVMISNLAHLFDSANNSSHYTVWWQYLNIALPIINCFLLLFMDSILLLAYYEKLDPPITIFAVCCMCTVLIITIVLVVLNTCSTVK